MEKQTNNYKYIYMYTHICITIYMYLIPRGSNWETFRVADNFANFKGLTSYPEPFQPLC